MVFYAGMTVDGLAEFGADMAEAPKKVKAALKSAVTSGAYYFRDQVKIAAAEGLPEWKALSPVTPTMAAYPANKDYTMGLTAKRQAAKVHASSAYKGKIIAAKDAGADVGGMRKTAREAKSFIKQDFRKTVGKGFLGKLQNVFRYKVSPDGLSVVVGVLPEFTKPKGVSYFTEFQEGGDAGPDNAMFKSMQRYFYGLGFKKSRKPMYNKPRELINPVFERQREAVMATMQLKFDAKMEGRK